MSETLINLITAPDKLLNNNPSLLLVNPSDQLKESFNFLAKDFKQPINLYLHENNEDDTAWLLDCISLVDHIVLDVDNTKVDHWLIGYILSFGKTFYLTNTPDRLYNVVNINRIYELKQFMEGVKYFEIQQVQS
tara:strand:+ start:101 stop:502 length:402 start_codon:yes stop_codon:yes gene_type:complete